MSNNIAEIQKRQKLHVRFLIIQILNILTGVALVSMGDQGQFGLTRYIIMPIQGIVLLALLVSIFLLISRFLIRWQKVAYGILLIVPNLFIGAPDMPNWIYLMTMICLFSINVIAVSIMTKDVFLNQNHV